MRFYLTAALAIASTTILPGLAYAQTVKQIEARDRAIAKAEQSYVMAGCKLESLRKNVGKASTTVYFTFMAECLTRVAAK